MDFSSASPDASQLDRYWSCSSLPFQKIPPDEAATDLQTKDRRGVLAADLRPFDFADRCRVDPVGGNLGVLEGIVDREHHILRTHRIERAAQRCIGANA